MKNESRYNNRALIESLPKCSPQRMELERQEAERAAKIKERVEALKHGPSATYQAGTMVRALDRGNIGYVVRPAGPEASCVEFRNQETGRRATLKMANSNLELLAPPSERQARIQTLSVGSLERLKLEREEMTAREGLAVFNAIEVPDAVLGVGSHVKAPGVAGALGKTGFVESLDEGKAIVRYYDGAGTPARDLVTEDASKLTVLANPSPRMEALARMPEGAARDDMLRKEQEYRRGQAVRANQLVSGKGGKGGGGLDGLLRQAQHGLSVATREVVGGLSIESR